MVTGGDKLVSGVTGLFGGKTATTTPQPTANIDETTASPVITTEIPTTTQGPKGTRRTLSR